jgi:hypothetical protein
MTSERTFFIMIADFLTMLKPPEVHIPRPLWNKIIKAASESPGKCGDERAFGLFAERRSKKKLPIEYLGNPYHVRETKEIKLKHITRNIWLYGKQKKGGFYPEKDVLRYVGSVEIRSDINLNFLDAYWMAREKVDIRILVDSAGKSNGYWVNHRTGEFHEINPIITDASTSIENV